MRRVYLLLARMVARDLLLVHLAGIGLLSLAVAVEAADAPLDRLWAALRLRVPVAWGLAVPALTLVGAVIAMMRARSQGAMLALGAAGASPRHAMVVAALIGALLGAFVPAETRPEEWTRGVGGWIGAAGVIPDEPGGSVTPMSSGTANIWSLLTTASAGALGAAVGLYRGVLAAAPLAATLFVADAVGRGLAERGAPTAAMGTAVAVLALGAVLAQSPLFPSRTR